MKKEVMTVFSCDHCGKISRSAGAMKLHEESCKKNPSNIPMCYGCEHYKEERSDDESCVEDVLTDDWNPYGEEVYRSVHFDYLQYCHQGDGSVRLYNGRYIRRETEQTYVEECLGWKRCPTCTEGCPHFKNSCDDIFDNRFGFEL